jgi:hypothetical protein
MCIIVNYSSANVKHIYIFFLKKFKDLQSCVFAKILS